MATYIDAVSVTLYQNGDPVFTFGEPDFKIKELDGFRRHNFDVRSQEFGIIDGGSVLGSRVKTVERTVVVHCLDSVVAKHDVTSALQDALSLTEDVTLGLTYFGSEYKCTGRFSRFDMSEGNIYEPLEITFSVMCGDPYFTVEIEEPPAWSDAEKTIMNASKVATLPRYMVVSLSSAATASGSVHMTTIDRHGNDEDTVNTAIPGRAGIIGLAFMWTYNPLLQKDIEVPKGLAMMSGTQVPFSQLGISADWQTVRVGEGGIRISVTSSNLLSVSFSYPVKTKWV